MDEKQPAIYYQQQSADMPPQSYGTMPQSQQPAGAPQEVHVDMPPMATAPVLQIPLIYPQIDPIEYVRKSQVEFLEPILPAIIHWFLPIGYLLIGQNEKTINALINQVLFVLLAYSGIIIFVFGIYITLAIAMILMMVTKISEIIDIYKLGVKGKAGTPILRGEYAIGFLSKFHKLVPKLGAKQYRPEDITALGGIPAQC